MMLNRLFSDLLPKLSNNPGSLAGPGMQLPPGTIPINSPTATGINPQLMQLLQPKPANNLLNLGLGLMQAGGPSETPTNFLGILGGAGMYAKKKKEAQDQMNIQKLLQLSNLKRQGRLDQLNLDKFANLKEQQKLGNVRADKQLGVQLSQDRRAQDLHKLNKKLIQSKIDAAGLKAAPKFKRVTASVPNDKGTRDNRTAWEYNGRLFLRDDNGPFNVGGVRYSEAPKGSVGIGLNYQSTKDVLGGTAKEVSDIKNMMTVGNVARGIIKDAKAMIKKDPSITGPVGQFRANIGKAIENIGVLGKATIGKGDWLIGKGVQIQGATAKLHTKMKALVGPVAQNIINLSKQRMSNDDANRAETLINVIRYSSSPSAAMVSLTELDSLLGKYGMSLEKRLSEITGKRQSISTKNQGGKSDINTMRKKFPELYK